MPKTLSELYRNAHLAKARQQNRRHNNPITEAPGRVPERLQEAIDEGLLSVPEARKIATKLGRRSYGEIGLTTGVVDMVLGEVLPHSHPSRFRLSGRLSR